MENEQTETNEQPQKKNLSEKKTDDVGFATGERINSTPMPHSNSQIGGSGGSDTEADIINK